MPALRCPRCLSALPSPSTSEGARVPLAECPNCGGVWAAGAAPERLKQSLEGTGAEARAGHARARFDRRDAVSCPECRAPMVRFTHEESGVVLDACPAHGIFFDCDELPQVARAAEARAAELQAAATRPGGGPPPLPKAKAPKPEDDEEEDGGPVPEPQKAKQEPGKLKVAAAWVVVTILEGLLS